MSRTADVVIVGAGFAGCATAWTLRERGVRALVLERETELGRHASGRGAGLGRQLAEDDDTSGMTIRGAAILRERFADAWTPCGGILTFEDLAAAEAYGERARRLDVAHERIDRETVLREWPTRGLSIAAAIRVPSDGVLDPRRLLRQFAADLDIEFGARVVRMFEHGTGVRVETATEAIDARVVVDACGAWAGAATEDPPLEVFKRHLFTLAIALGERRDTRPYLWHLGSKEYYVRTTELREVMASPCDAEPTPALLDPQPSADADARLAERLPFDAGILSRWACQRTFAPDRKMRIGRDTRRPWLVWAAALGGHGATASAAVGAAAADAVMEVLG